ncbi:MAG: hypothetical protein H0V31_05690 [Acidobacteria bacterium]|nr:hypothetical protein [Acidobacteriota bacterium]
METLIFIGCFYNLAFAVFHLFFWKLFRWREDLRSLSFVNRGVMQILNLCLAFVFLVFAYVSFFHTAELLTTNIGRTLLAAIALFWLFRAIEQIVFFGWRKIVSVAFFVFFLFGAAIYFSPFLF